jgi:hypothetical protein
LTAWYRTDEKENAVDYLEAAADFYSREHPHKWKWLTISLHAALYGFSILAIKGTDPDRVKKGKNLISLWEALKRCQNDTYMRQYSDSQTLTLSPDEKRSIEKLSDAFRNNFEHFMPTLWSIEVSGFPIIVRNVSRVIEFLASQSRNVHRQLTSEQQSRVVAALQTLEK